MGAVQLHPTLDAEDPAVLLQNLKHLAGGLGITDASRPGRRRERQPFRQFAERDNGTPDGCTVLAIRSQLGRGEGIAALGGAGLRRVVQLAGD